MEVLPNEETKASSNEYFEEWRKPDPILEKEKGAEAAGTPSSAIRRSSEETFRQYMAAQGPVRS
jgi:hypothetical protein